MRTKDLLGALHRRLPNWLLESIPAMALALMLLIPYLHYPFLWDSGWYHECLENAVHNTFKLENYLCFKHPSLLFIGFFSIPERIFPGQIWAIRVVIFLLHIMSIGAFGSICSKLLPKTNVLIRTITIAIYAIQPAILANITGFNLDVIVTSCYVIVISALLYKQHTLAIAVGIFMTFNKETGVLFYSLAVGVHWITVIMPQYDSLTLALKKAYQHAPYLIPPILFVLYFLSGISFFNGHDSGDLVKAMLTFDAFDPRFHLMLTDIFVLQFAWFQTLVIILSGMLFSLKKMRNKELYYQESARIQWFAIILFIGTIYCVTRYFHFNNIRYLMIAYPLAIAIFAISVVHLAKNNRVRITLLSSALLLEIVGLYFSIDPLSQYIFGTFQFGKRTMYPLGIHDDFCCKYGRDQLAYNFQHLQMVTLQDKIFQIIKPQEGTIIGNHPLSWFGFNEGFDPQTFTRVSGPNAVMPLYLNAQDLITMQDPPSSFWYIAYPNFQDQADQLNLLKRRFDLIETKTVQNDGYGISIFHYSLR